MNKIVNKFWLAGDKLGLLIVLEDHLQKTKKEFKNVKKQEIQTTFTTMNLIRLVFSMIWLIKILKI